MTEKQLPQSTSESLGEAAPSPLGGSGNPGADSITSARSPSYSQDGMAPGGVWRTFSSLRIRNYRWFWIGMLFGFSAMQMQQVARGWLVYEMTGSALALGAIMAAAGIPMLLFSLLGGVAADRFDKRNLLIIVEGSIGLVNLVVAILIALNAVEFWHLLVASLATGAMFSFYMPTRQSIVPELVGERDLFNAIALNTSGMNLTRIAAPAIAGVLVGIIGVAGVYYIIAACYFIIMVTLLPIPSTGNRGGKLLSGAGQDIMEGLNYIRRSQTLLILLAMALVVSLFAMPYLFLMPVFAVKELGRGAIELGVMMGVSGIGALAGSLTIGSLGRDFNHKGWLSIIMVLSFGASLLFFASARSYPLSLVALVFVGIANTGFMAVNNTLIMTNVTHEVRGRVMSVYMMTFGLQSAGMLFIGILADGLGAPAAVGLGAIITIIATLACAILTPQLRRLE
ncbi:MAG: MFS transporter [Chloroflexi bacterium]|nr:MFS transporter [Chloroflexota bacterium]